MVKWLRETIQFLNGFRKFSVMMVLVIVGVVFRVLGYVNGAEFVSLLSATAVAYMAGNGLEHMTTAIKEWIKKKNSDDK